MPSATTCVPTIASSAPAISAWMSHSRPNNAEVRRSRSARSGRRRAAIAAPGKMNRWLGEWTSRKRRCRHPSLKLESFDSPPRGWYSIGNWRISSFSLARGSPSRRRTPFRSCAGRGAAERRGGPRACRSARRRRPVLNSTFRKPGQQRVADVAVMPGHRARVDVLHPVADHHVGAALEFGEEVRRLLEVVGQVGVGHQDVFALGRQRDRPGRRSRSPARARRRRARRRPSASAPLPSLGAVVGDDHLAGDAVGVERVAGAGGRTPRSCLPHRDTGSRPTAEPPRPCRRASDGRLTRPRSCLFGAQCVQRTAEVRACPPPLATRRLASDKIYARMGAFPTRPSARST